MAKHSFCLRFLRRPLLWRDALVITLVTLFWMMPCYAGIPAWWGNNSSAGYNVNSVYSSVLDPSKADDNYAALNVGQMKNLVSKAVFEMNHKTVSGTISDPMGAGTALNAEVASWNTQKQMASNSDMVNVGQLKYIMKMVYDRLNEYHGTTGYPWPIGKQDSYWQAVNVGQLKSLLALDLTLPPDRNLSQHLGTEAPPELTPPPSGVFQNRNTVLAAGDHYLNNPNLSLLARGSPTGLPPNADKIDNAPVATIPGEFTVGQDGAATYTLNLQGPKGVGNVEPGISLGYNSNGGDGVAGLGWTIGGISAISRGPATQEVDGFNDPVDFDDLDRFYLDGDRLICVVGNYGEDGSQYRTLREQFSRVTYYKKNATAATQTEPAKPAEDYFKVETKAGLEMTFGKTELASVRPWVNGAPTNEGRLSWALDRVEDNLGNYWDVVYGELSPGAFFAEGKPYFPDYQPLAVRYTGFGSRAPDHSIRFVYERRPDQTRGYSWGALVRKEKRLSGIEIATSGTVIRAYKLRYNLDDNFIALRGERSMVQGIQEFAGPWDLASTPRLPETTFEWDEGPRSWQALANETSQTINWPGGTVPWGEDWKLTFERQSSITRPDSNQWFPKGGQFIDLNGDGISEILFNHRGPFWTECSEPGDQERYNNINDTRYILKKSAVDNSWDYEALPNVESATPRRVTPSGGSSYSHPTGLGTVANVPIATTGFPYLSTADGTPTGALLMDVNFDGLPDIVSSGTFNEAAYKWGTRYNTYYLQTDRKITNAKGVWLNTGGNFQKDTSGTWDFPDVPTEWIASDGAVPTARPATIASQAQYNRLLELGVDLPTATTFPMNLPTGALSGADELMAAPRFSGYNEKDLGWRTVDMDGDGYMDLIRAGQGKSQSGWATSDTNSTPIATGTGALSTAGRELCFGLRNKGPNATAGSRWELMNPSPTENNIWKLPLPLVDDDGSLDMGRRLIDLNGDGLPDFIAQKKRTAVFPGALFTAGGHDEYDMEVWMNRGSAGWEYGGDPWRLEGVGLGYRSATDYGRSLQDINGDALPDFVISWMYYANNPDYNPDLGNAEKIWFYQEAVFLNTGKGWVKEGNKAVNFPNLVPPVTMSYHNNGTTIARAVGLGDLNGDGRPEFRHANDPTAKVISGSTKVGLTQFLDPVTGTWVESPELNANNDWNLADELLSTTTFSAMQMGEIDGDGISDIFRSKRSTSSLSEVFLRRGLSKPARIKTITNGLGVPIEITYGNLAQLAAPTFFNTATNKVEPHPMNRYRSTTSTLPDLVKGTPSATVVTDYTTFDGTENADGSVVANTPNGGKITTSYFYAGLRSHNRKGSLGFEKMETRTSRSPVRSETIYNQDASLLNGDAISMPVTACGYTSTSPEPFAATATRTVLSKVSTEYRRVEISEPAQDYLLPPKPLPGNPPPPLPPRERLGKKSFMVYAYKVVSTNRSPEGAELGSTESISEYHLTGLNAGLLWKQAVTQDQATPATINDDTQSLTEHTYFPRTDSPTSWRIGQIQQSTATSRRPGTAIPDMAKTSSFTYYTAGAKAGMLETETIDPGQDFAVTKTHYYDTRGNEIKTVTTADGADDVVSETFYSDDGRFAVASKNTLGHASVTTYDPVKSLATSATVAFASSAPSTGAGLSAKPSAPSGTLQTSTSYDAWGTAKVTTSADGLKSVRLTQFFKHDSLPRCLYYVYEQAQGGTPVITYYDRYHTPLLVEKTGYNGETIFQESTTKFLYDQQGTYTGAQKLGTQPYFASDPPPPYSIEEQDVYGRKKRVISADGSESFIKYVGLQSFTYTLRGGSDVAANNPRMRTHTRVVDQAERPLLVIDNVGSSVAFKYAADGQPLEATTSYSGTDSVSADASTTISTTYNAQRLKESVTDPNAGKSYTFYDSYGRAVLTRDTMGKGTATEFDKLSRPVRTLTGIDVPAPADVAGPKVINAWIKSLPAVETETVYTYDTAPGFGLGKAATVTFKEYERDANGAVTATRTVEETYVYDALGRSISGSTTLSGQVAFDGTYNVSSTYDALGRVNTVTDAGGYTRASRYNDYGFLSSIHEGTSAGNFLWQGMNYDASGKMLEEWHGNGIKTVNRYHPTRGFLESTRTQRAMTNAHIQETEMQLDDLGNVLWRREQRFETEFTTPGTPPVAGPLPVRIETFGYDRLNRLTYSQVTGQALQSFTFTSNGNIASKSGIGSYTYGQRNHGTHAVTSVSQGTQVQRSYTYDPKGRMTHEHNGDSVSGLALREIAYTSFDQPRFIQHWGAAALSSDQGQLDDGTTAWDQICTINFYFGPGLQRLIQKKVKGKLATTTLSLGGYEIREVTGHTGTVIEREERSSFGNGVRVKRYLGPKETTSAQTSYEFAAKDHLGSDTATFDGQGQLRQQRGHLKPGEQQKTERQSYDAWGARRDGDTWAPAAGQLGTVATPPPQGNQASPPERLGSNLPRGYTGHEMLDDVGLVHMNGRLYDSALGRMCAADRDVQAPDMIQNYNRYSYVLNNPMNATDPSGHNWFKKILMIIVAVIIAVILIMVAVYAIGLLAANAGGALGAVGSAATATSAATTGTGLAGIITGTTAGASSFLGLNVSIWVGATVGATWSAVNTAIAGGNFGQILKASVTGAANGAAGAIVGGYMHGLGADWGSALTPAKELAKAGTQVSALGTAAHIAAHGVAGGAMSAANGGSFRDGFIGGLIGAGTSGLGLKLYGGTALAESGALWAIAGRTAIAAVAGGLGSKALGGKFADGAYSAAFFHLFNAESKNLSLAFKDSSFWDGVKPEAFSEGFRRWRMITGDMFMSGTPNADAGEYQKGSWEDKLVTGLNITAAVTGSAAGAAALFAPEAGVAVVWSGTANGEMAATYASVNGLKTLGMTAGGKLITPLATRLPWALQKPIWQATSIIYVSNARSVQIFVDKIPNFSSIYYKLEHPILRWRGLVP
jgi:RHS repeat-associated protein